MASWLDATIAFSLAALLIVGGYQIYFLPQRYPLRRPINLLLSLDNRIPFWPQWVWIYSLLYYPSVLSTILTIRDFRQFAYTAANFTILLMAQVTIAFLLPVGTPDLWRAYDQSNSVSERFLGLVQSFDKGGNGFPSMHVAVATLSALHISHNLINQFGPVSYAIFVLPVTISVSALFTKQHVLLDIPAGMALALAIFSLHEIFYGGNAS